MGEVAWRLDRCGTHPSQNDRPGDKAHFTWTNIAGPVGRRGLCQPSKPTLKCPPLLVIYTFCGGGYSTLNRAETRSGPSQLDLSQVNWTSLISAIGIACPCSMGGAKVVSKEAVLSLPTEVSLANLGQSGEKIDVQPHSIQSKKKEADRRE